MIHDDHDDTYTHMQIPDHDLPYSWHHAGHSYTLANGLTGDPALYAMLNQHSDAVMFDLGTIDQLPHKTLLKARLACVSHTHFDHFIGFDRFLRVNIPHRRPMELCGPVGLAENVRHKIKGYTWNLLEPEQLRFVVHEVDRQGRKQSFSITNTTGFHLQEYNLAPQATHATFSPPLPQAPVAWMTTLADGSRIEAVVLDHGIDSVAYCIQSPLKFSLRIEELAPLGLAPGPWISALQKKVRDLQYDDELTIDGRAFRVGDLSAAIFSYAAPRTVGYVTDAAYSEANLLRLEQLLGSVELLVCEASFIDKDEDKATQKKHLTTRQACSIAARVNAQKLQTFHYSKIYARDVRQHELEVTQFMLERR